MGASTIAMASALRVVVQVAVLPVIGHLLGPHVYGQMALVAPFVFFSMMIAESGLGACIVRAATVTRALEGTVFCFSAGLSLIFMLAFALLARPLGRYLHEPMFPGLLIGMSTILVLASFNIVPAAILVREKKYNWIAASDVASSIGSLSGVGAGIALGWGAWSLVAQQIAFWICKLAIVLIGARSLPRLVFRWPVLRENMQFGSRLTGAGIVSFLARNIDNILIGRFMGTEALGFYALAFQIVSMPQMIVAGSVYYTLFAGSSEAVRSGRSPKNQFLAIFRGIMLLCMPAIVGLAATANLSMPLVMGVQWTPAAELIVLLAPFGFCQLVGAAFEGMLSGLGRADTLLRAQLLSSGATIVAILAAVHFGSPAVAIGVSLTAFISPVVSMRAIARDCAIGHRELYETIRNPIAASLLMGVGVATLQHLFPATLPLFAALTICVVAGVVLYAGAMLVLLRERFSEEIAEIKLAMRRQKATV